MTTVSELCDYLDDFAPPALAEDWDNTGLLLGDRAAAARRVMTCLTLTPDSVAEAVERDADLVVAHHPLPFRPVARLTTDTTEGRMLWRLAGEGVSVYSPHTAFDSAAEGINQSIATLLGLKDAEPLIPADDAPQLGAGRVGTLEAELGVDELAARVKQALGAAEVRVTGGGGPIARVATACGSGGSFIAAAVAAGADALVTGEATFHNCLAAQAAGLTLLLPGHYASERFALESLAERLQQRFDGLTVWASEREHDPLRTL